ncbi:DNA repair protein RAD51 homolog 4 [Pagrus major]|uniref:DNA repair protein RAD51 homolog 4 n=1 Tax=Pagrus major TaxID=143350 RepID=UPI003CC85064
MVALRGGMCPGLDEDLVKDLRAADIKTVEDLVSSDTEEVAQRCSVSYKALFAIRRVLLAQHTAFPVSGADLYEELLSSTAILSSGHPSLDKLLDSGFYTGEITELSGGPGSGKSQVCFGLAVHVSFHLKQSVIFIDTTGGLTAKRLLQMLQTESSNREEQMEALQRIHIFRLFDVFSLLDCLYSLRAGRLQQASVGGGGSVKAVIVDSVSAVISPLLGAKHNEGMSLMIQVAGVLKTMAKDFNVAALVTNHVTRSDGGGVQPGLGVSWSHIPRTRILMEKLDRTSVVSCSSLRSATLIKSSRQPCHIRGELDLRWWSRSAEGSSGKRKLDETDS